MWHVNELNLLVVCIGFQALISEYQFAKLNIVPGVVHTNAPVISSLPITSRSVGGAIDK